MMKLHMFIISRHLIKDIKNPIHTLSLIISQNADSKSLKINSARTTTSNTNVNQT